MSKNNPDDSSKPKLAGERGNFGEVSKNAVRRKHRHIVREPGHREAEDHVPSKSSKPQERLTERKK
jgi:hypothetical protein